MWTILDDEFIPEVISFFSKRYPLFTIMIQHKNKTYVKKGKGTTKVHSKNVEELIKLYEQNLPNHKLLNNLSINSQELWNTFYNTQYIKQRKNHRLFHKFIPKYLKNCKGLQKEFSALNPCKKLTDF